MKDSLAQYGHWRAIGKTLAAWVPFWLPSLLLPSVSDFSSEVCGSKAGRITVDLSTTSVLDGLFWSR